MDAFDIDDELCWAALEEVESKMQQQPNKQTTLFQSFGIKPPVTGPKQTQNDTFNELPIFSHRHDPAEIGTWVYPTNRPIRDYQFNIIQKSLFLNTLVALPTGLGKTFCAAVVMYNYFRWFPEGKIVFMAPTKPLVTQQIDACYEITGMSPLCMEELTGNTNPVARALSWQSKKVFFLTPQVLKNDLAKGTCPAHQITLLVVDEAHRATGNHAYCEVVRLLNAQQCHYRILALTATPGGDSKTVQDVVDNLMISHIEIRTEDSIDIRPFIHKKNTDSVVVKLSPEIKDIQTRFARIASTYLNRLGKYKVIYETDALKLHQFQLIQARERFRQNRAANLSQIEKLVIEGDFGVCISLLQALSLLYQHGIQSFYTHLKDYIAETLKTKTSKVRREACTNTQMIALMNDIEKSMSLPTFVSHPKLSKLENVVISHFLEMQDLKMESRAMIFSQYRESVDEICKKLNEHDPLLRVMAFVGQSSGKNKKGYTQKEQIAVIKKFQSGNYNVLVCTSIGEEGLDIGEVDLIVCYDASASPIRMLQRMGRTGRKRDGKIILLMTEGREEENHKKSQQGYKNVQKSINEGRKMNFVKPIFKMGFPKPVCEKKELVIVQGDMQRQREMKKSGSSMSSESDAKRKKSKLVEKENANEDKIDSNKKVSKPKKRKKSIAISKLMDINESDDDIVTLSQIMGQGNNATSNRDVKPSKKESPIRLVPSTSIELTIPKESKTENLYGIPMSFIATINDEMIQKARDYWPKNPYKDFDPGADLEQLKREAFPSRNNIVVPESPVEPISSRQLIPSKSIILESPHPRPASSPIVIEDNSFEIPNQSTSTALHIECILPKQPEGDDFDDDFETDDLLLQAAEEFERQEGLMFAKSQPHSTMTGMSSPVKPFIMKQKFTSKIMSSSPPSSIQRPKKKANQIVMSTPDVSIIDNDTWEAFSISQKTPIIKKRTKKRPTLKQLQDMVDVEAQMSMSDGEGGRMDANLSEDEYDGSSLDTDISGFVVKEPPSETSEQKTPASALAFYQRTLLTQPGADMGFKSPSYHPGRFKLKYPQKIMSDTPERYSNYDESLGSLADFIVDDEDELYESKSLMTIEDDDFV